MFQTFQFLFTVIYSEIIENLPNSTCFMKSPLVQALNKQHTSRQTHEQSLSEEAGARAAVIRKASGDLRSMKGW